MPILVINLFNNLLVEKIDDLTTEEMEKPQSSFSISGMILILIC